MAGAKTKTTKPQGADIRGFFGASSNHTPPSRLHSNSSSQVKAKAYTIEISDDEPRKSPAKAAISTKAEPVDKKPEIVKAHSSKSHVHEADRKSKSERVMVEDSDGDVKPRPTLKRKKAVLFSSDDEEEEVKKASPPRKKPAVAAASGSKPPVKGSSAKAKPGQSTARRANAAAKKSRDADFVAEDDAADDGDYQMDEDEDETPKKGKAKAKPAPKKPPAKSESSKSSAKAKATRDEDPPNDDEKPKPKFNWAAARAAKQAGPVAPGSKPAPQPIAPDCLAGLSFVFTGELSSFSRDEAIELAKRNGGRVIGQPSSKTSYVVLGADAGPSKLAAIKKNNLKTLDEDGFLDLIATRVPNSSKLDDKTKKKLEKERDAIRQGAAEMEKREKAARKDAIAQGSSSKLDASTQLWTDRYAPQTLKEVCGNKGQVEKLQLWLHDWSSSLKSGFKKPGKNGMNMSRAVMITGSPGIGKTTSAHLCAKLEGFTVIELNASDARSKKLVENSTNITNTSLDGWMTGGHGTNAAGVEITDKTCLIMDEVDGMSAGDRGGVGALAALIRKSKIPIICIANDRGAQKLKPLTAVTFNLIYKKPEVTSIRSRVLTISFKEKMKIPANVIDQLIEGAQSDIRQVLNMLSTWKLSSDTMDFDEGKTLTKMNEKHAIQTPFNIINKMLGPYMFSSTSRETLNDKMELYFHDHSFIPLFMQENYLKTQPTKLKHSDGHEKTLKHLELMDKAASSISDGDLVDSLIHGPEQHWSLMPLHAVCSTIRPASFLYGMGSGYGGPNAMSFPQWLGQNSKQNKLSRQLTDVQARMRLKVSGDKADIRQSYLPALFPHIVQPLMDEGVSAVDEIIGRMDEYYLSREDWDTVVELGVDQHKDDLVLKNISTATKTAFTRKYNSREHPVPFYKTQGNAPKKLAAAGPLPDLEEAFDVNDEAEAVEDVEEKNSAEDDITLDKLIKVPKGKKIAAGKSKNFVSATSKSKGKGKTRS